MAKSQRRIPVAPLAGGVLILAALLRWEATPSHPAIVAGRIGNYPLGLGTPLEFVVLAIGILVTVAGMGTPPDAHAATATLVYAPSGILVIGLGVGWPILTPAPGFGTILAVGAGLILIIETTLRWWISRDRA